MRSSIGDTKANHMRAPGRDVGTRCAPHQVTHSLCPDDDTSPCRTATRTDPAYSAASRVLGSEQPSVLQREGGRIREPNCRAGRKGPAREARVHLVGAAARLPPQLTQG